MSCDDEDVMVCPNCDAQITPIQVRFEDEPRTRDYPGSFTRGCVHCLSGRHVYMPGTLTAQLLDAYWDRRISEARES